MNEPGSFRTDQGAAYDARQRYRHDGTFHDFVDRLHILLLERRITPRWAREAVEMAIDLWAAGNYKEPEGP